MQSCVLTYSRLRRGSCDSSGFSSVSMASPLRRARIKAQGFQLQNIIITYIVKAPTLSGFPAFHSHKQGRERLCSVNPVPVWRQQNNPPAPLRFFFFFFLGGGQNQHLSQDSTMAMRSRPVSRLLRRTGLAGS